MLRTNIMSPLNYNYDHILQALLKIWN